MPHFLHRPYFVVIFLLFSLLHADSYRDLHWYHSFYDMLRAKEIHSIRYFQLWVAPQHLKQEQLPLIGGSEDNFLEWQNAVEELLASSVFYKNTWDGHLVYEITVDKRTYQQHEKILSAWQQQYPSTFKVSFIEDFKKDEADIMSQAYEHCLCGIPSVCSDYWRWAYADSPEFEINIYADIDTFSQGLHHKISDSADGLGVSLPNFGIFMPAFFKDHSYHINTDMLIFYKPKSADLRVIQALFEQELRDQHIALNNLNTKALLENITSFQQYQQFLEERVELFMKHDKQQLNRYFLIVSVIGPNFWNRMAQRGLVSHYRNSFADDVSNTMSWSVFGMLEFYEKIDAYMLQHLVEPADLNNLVRLLLMTFDRGLIRKNASTDFLNDFDASLNVLMDKTLPVIAHINKPLSNFRHDAMLLKKTLS